MDYTVQVPDDEAGFIDAAAQRLDLPPGEVVRVAMGLLRNEIGLNGHRHAIEVGRANTPPWRNDLDAWFDKIR